MTSALSDTSKPSGSLNPSSSSNLKNSKDLSISEFFGNYPDIADPSFNTEIARKTEFVELQPQIREAVPKKGTGYNHQKFQVRYLSIYKRTLLVHEPGSGKSCIIVHSAELFKREYLKAPDDPTRINRAIILVSGDALLYNIRNEIVCKCTDRVYETIQVPIPSNPNVTHEDAQKKAIRKELKGWYDIMTYHDFANLIREMKRDDEVEKFMSNKAIYVDEGHNLPTLEDHRNFMSGKKPPRTVTEARQKFGEALEKFQTLVQNQPTKAGKKPPKTGESDYETIHRSFHWGKRNLIAIATATPMINSSQDFAPLMNLLLPLDFQMPNWKESDYDQLPISVLEPFLRGRVSYIRSLDTGAQPVPIGDAPTGWTTKIYRCLMSDFQYAQYYDAAKQYEFSDTEDQDERDYFSANPRHASNFVFPDRTFGKEGFQNHIELVDGVYQIRNTPQGQQLRNYIRNPDGFRVLSRKYYEIVKLCLESFANPGDIITPKKGVIFIYFPDFVKGSGAILLGLCLREYGYTEFTSSRSLFSSATTGGDILSPCPSTSTSIVQERRSLEGQKKRFALLTGHTTAPQIAAILDTVNSHENRYGQYLQIIIASRKAKEGININNAVKQIMVSSSWNHSNNHQARERVFRSTSHVTRLEEEARKLNGNQDAENLNPEIPTVTFPVNTYNMASVYSGDPNAQIDFLKVSDDDTVDTKMYIRSERKDRAIRKVMRAVKVSAYDCQLNRVRNIRPTDIDGSTICDYTDCNYVCFGVDPAQVAIPDNTTKILYHSEEEIKTTAKKIQDLFTQYYSLRIDQIQNLLPDIPYIYIIIALERLIQNNDKFVDRFGYTGYLREGANNLIYLEKDQFEVQAYAENTIYTSVLNRSQDIRNTFDDYIANRNLVTDDPLRQQIWNAELTEEQVQNLLNEMSLIAKVSVLEEALEKEITGNSTPRVREITAFFNEVIFHRNEPTENIRKAAEELANRGKGQGRKAKYGSKMKSKKEPLKNLEQLALTEEEFDASGPPVILHTLLNETTRTRTNYGDTAKFLKSEGQIRIYKLSETQGWRNVSESEHRVYNNWIKREISKLIAPYEKYPIYGIMIPPSTILKIRDKESEDETKVGDLRTSNIGRVCTYKSVPMIINILYRLKIPSGVNIPPNTTREDIYRFLRTVQFPPPNLTEKSEEELIHLYGWYQRDMSKTQLCTEIQKYFMRHNMIFTGVQRPEIASNYIVGSVHSGNSLTPFSVTESPESLIVPVSQRTEIVSGVPSVSLTTPPIPGMIGILPLNLPPIAPVSSLSPMISTILPQTTLPANLPQTTLPALPSNLPQTTLPALPSNLPQTTLPAIPSAIPSAVPANLPQIALPAIPSAVPSNLPQTALPAIPSAVPSNLPQIALPAIPSAVPSNLPQIALPAISSAIPSNLPQITLPSNLPQTTLPQTTLPAIPSVIPSNLPQITLPSYPYAYPKTENI